MTKSCARAGNTTSDTNSPTTQPTATSITLGMMGALAAASPTPAVAQAARAIPRPYLAVITPRQNVFPLFC
jgi:hypothetical protein